MSENRPQPPSFLRRLGTDEYAPRPLNERERRAVRSVMDRGAYDAARTGHALGDYWSSRLGTAAGLRALNQEFGADFYQAPAEAAFDQGAADAVFGGDDVVIDVHTHFMADRPRLHTIAASQIESYRRMAPQWWRGLDGMQFYSLAEYLRCVFLESETTIAVLTSPPADGTGVPFLSNAELAATRELIDRLAGAGRLFNHLVVHPTEQHSIDSLEAWRDKFRPSAWKVYTMGRMASDAANGPWEPGTDWMLDDEQYGLPFLERSRTLGMRRVCAHKGLSVQANCGSPRDFGPVARLFPNMKFCAYHAGFEGDELEGPYTEGTRDQGANRLIATMRDHGVSPNANIYADLGTTWFILIKRPLEAAHLLGKLLVHVGEDNILWGTDATWYGPTQPAIDAFRAFQIPDELCERHGYPKLTPDIRSKILGRNAARFYDIDLEAARKAAVSDDLAWTRAALREAATIR